MTKRELLIVAKEIGLTGYSRMNKSQLAAAIAQRQSEIELQARADAQAALNAKLRDANCLHVAVALVIWGSRKITRAISK